MAGRTESNQQWVAEYISALKQPYLGETEMDMTQYSGGESKDLKAKDFVGKNMKVKISKVSIRDYPVTDEHPASSKPALSFVGKEKTLILNASNTKVLCDAYGKDSESWVNHEIGLTVKDYSDKGFGHGWVVTPLDVKAPEFESDVPF